MPSVSGPMTTAIGRPINEPALFVEIGLTPVVRLSSRATTTWNALTWTGANIDVTGYEMGMDIVQSLTLSLGDADLSFAALFLNVVATGLAVKVWVYDASALAVGDPVIVFDGQIDGMSADKNRQLTIPCRVPNKYLPSGLLSQVLPSYFFAAEGAVLRWGAGTVVLNRRQEFA